MELTAGEAMAPENTGLLIRVQGTVTEVLRGEPNAGNPSGAGPQFLVEAETGKEALVYINAYINPGVPLEFVKTGAKVSVIGLASIGENFADSEFLPRIRVRDRSEIEPDGAAELGKMAVALSPDALTATCKLRNETAEPLKLTMHVAVYTHDGKLKYIKQSAQVIGASEAVDFIVTLDIPGFERECIDNGYSIKTFMWYTDTWAPYLESYRWTMGP
jgi:hypothetical protein